MKGEGGGVIPFTQSSTSSIILVPDCLVMPNFISESFLPKKDVDSLRNCYLDLFMSLSIADAEVLLKSFGPLSLSCASRCICSLYKLAFRILR